MSDKFSITHEVTTDPRGIIFTDHLWYNNEYTGISSATDIRSRFNRIYYGKELLAINEPGIDSLTDWYFHLKRNGELDK